MLVNRVPSSIAHFGKRCISVIPISSSPDSQIRLEFDDGSIHHADMVIGADGIKSAIRNHVAGIDVQPEWSGTRAYRGLVEVEDVQRVMDDMGGGDALSPRMYFGLDGVCLFSIHGIHENPRANANVSRDYIAYSPVLDPAGEDCQLCGLPY